MNKKLLLILNPCSGQKKANKYIIDIISLFSKAGYDCTIHVTQCTGDASQYVADNASYYDLIVCIGGDGTLNEVITGILSCGVDVPLGYIPSGSTNDFANSLKLSKNVMQAAQDIINGKPNLYDIGCFNGRYFSYIASFGAFTNIFAMVSYDTPQNLKNAFGHFAYVMESLKELPAIKPIHAKITAGDIVYEDDFIFGAVSNSTSVAGILTLDPEYVDLSDGLLEVFLVKNPTTPFELSKIALSCTLRQYDNETVRFFSAEKIEIETSSSVNWTIDGEYEQGAEKIVIENLKHAIKLIK